MIPAGLGGVNGGRGPGAGAHGPGTCQNPGSAPWVEVARRAGAAVAHSRNLANILAAPAVKIASHPGSTRQSQSSWAKPALARCRAVGR